MQGLPLGELGGTNGLPFFVRHVRARVITIKANNT
jgi:hypothetical protein